MRIFQTHSEVLPNSTVLAVDRVVVENLHGFQIRTMTATGESQTMVIFDATAGRLCEVIINLKLLEES